MGLFNSLMSKIFGHAAPATAKGPQTAAAAPTTSGTQAAGATAQPAAAPAPPVVDVAAVLNDMAKKNPEKLASAAERAGVAGTKDTDFVGLVCAASKESP